MNVLFISITPIIDLDERGIYTDLLRAFLKQGHSLTIYSPEFDRNIEKKQYDNVNFHFIKSGPLTKVNPLRKILNYFIFSHRLSASLKSLVVNVDLVLYSTPPIQLVSPLRRFRKKTNAIYYLMLKDIFPQNAVDIELIRHNGITSFIYRHYQKMERRLYELSDYIGVMSPANKKYLLAQHPHLEKKIELLPNAIDLSNSPHFTSDRRSTRNRFELPVDDIISIFGGNIGKPQGIDFIQDIIALNENVDHSFLLFVGNGTEFKKLNDFIRLNNIKRARCIPQLAKIDFDELLFHCDIGLLFLDFRFTIPNFPSRILSYFEFSKPVLAATDKVTDIKVVLEDHKTGMWVPSNDPTNYIKKLKTLLEDSHLRNQMGANARQYLESQWTIEDAYTTIVQHF